MVTKTEGGDYGIGANAGDEEGAVAEGVESQAVTVNLILDAHRFKKKKKKKKKRSCCYSCSCLC
jgi:hypothetical protein